MELAHEQPGDAAHGVDRPLDDRRVDPDRPERIVPVLDPIGELEHRVDEAPDIRPGDEELAPIIRFPWNESDRLRNFGIATPAPSNTRRADACSAPATTSRVAVSDAGDPSSGRTGVPWVSSADRSRPTAHSTGGEDAAVSSGSRTIAISSRCPRLAFIDVGTIS